MGNIMQDYMTQLGETPLLTREEEVELAARIKQGDDSAREKLITSNLRLVVKIAHDFKGLGMPLLDLISEGNIGVMRAAEKFDPEKGAKFSTYAAWWIKQSMRRALSLKNRTIRIPIASAGKIKKIKKAELELTQELEREPTAYEVAERAGFSEKVVTRLKLNKENTRTIPLESPILEGESSELRNLIPDPTAVDPSAALYCAEDYARANALLGELDCRERQILVMRYGLDGNRPKTLEEISGIIGRTRERVRQIQNNALKKINTHFVEESAKLAQEKQSQLEKLANENTERIFEKSEALALADKKRREEYMKSVAEHYKKYQNISRTQTAFRISNTEVKRILEAQNVELRGYATRGERINRVSAAIKKYNYPNGTGSLKNIANKLGITIPTARRYIDECISAKRREEKQQAIPAPA